MALTAAQRASVRKYMGWPARYLQTNSALESAMDALALTPQDEAEVVALLTALANVDTRITAALGGAKVEQAGTIRLKDDNGMRILRREGRRLVGRVSAILGCPIQADAFGGASYGQGNDALFGG